MGLLPLAPYVPSPTSVLLHADLERTRKSTEEFGMVGIKSTNTMVLAILSASILLNADQW